MTTKTENSMLAQRPHFMQRPHIWTVERAKLQREIDAEVRRIVGPRPVELAVVALVAGAAVYFTVLSMVLR